MHRRFARAVILLCVGAACAGAAADRARPTVALDLTGLREEAYARLDGLGLEKRAVLRLVQDGFAVVAATAAPQVLLRLRETGSGLVLEAVAGGQTERRELPVGAERPAELHLEIVQKMVDLALAAERRLPPPPPASAPATAPAPASAAARPPAGPNPTPPIGATGPRVETTVGAGAAVRGGGVDALVHLEARLDVAAGLGLHLAGAWVPASAPGIDVTEWEIVAGPGYRIALGRDVSLEAALVAGALVHRFAVVGAPADHPSGTRVDFLAALPLVLGYAPLRSLVLALRAAPGLTDAGREHERDGQILWRRGSLRLETGATATWRFH
ncbi:MAG TPA: hypothetical protein VGQ83_20005 [Polyangia bacterium]|jgi:hypothetical protein